MRALVVVPVRVEQHVKHVVAVDKCRQPNNFLLSAEHARARRVKAVTAAGVQACHADNVHGRIRHEVAARQAQRVRVVAADHRVPLDDADGCRLPVHRQLGDDGLRVVKRRRVVADVLLVLMGL